MWIRINEGYRDALGLALWCVSEPHLMLLREQLALVVKHELVVLVQQWNPVSPIQARRHALIGLANYAWEELLESLLVVVVGDLAVLFHVLDEENLLKFVRLV